MRVADMDAKSKLLEAVNLWSLPYNDTTGKHRLSQHFSL
jgi:hypothetical protein